MQQAGSKRSPGENREDFSTASKQRCRCNNNEMLSGKNDPGHKRISAPMTGIIAGSDARISSGVSHSHRSSRAGMAADHDNEGLHHIFSHFLRSNLALFYRS